MKNLTAEQLEKKKKMNKKIIRFGCLPLVLVFVIILIFISQIKQEPNNASEAYVLSKTFVKARLDFPEEADFPILPVLAEKKEGTENTYKVVGDVTIKNAFGVKKKVRYLCIIKYLGGDKYSPNSWQLIDLSF